MSACSICAHPQSAALCADLATGLSVRKVGERYGVSPSAIQRHKGHSVVVGGGTAAEQASAAPASPSAASVPAAGPSGTTGASEGQPGAATSIVPHGFRGPLPTEFVSQARIGIAGAAGDPAEPLADRAATVDPTDRAARIEFIVGLFGAEEWVTHVTEAVLASAWGLRPGTVATDASDAALIVRTIADKSEMMPRFWAMKVALLQRTERLLAMAEGKLQGMAADISEANFERLFKSAIAAADSATRQLEQVGVGSGAVQAGAPTVVVNLSPEALANPRTAEQREAARMLAATVAGVRAALSEAIPGDRERADAALATCMRVMREEWVASSAAEWPARGRGR